eukprot:TRINITY_DN15910_c0_g1_i13.p1 TRINITY_DN15910_c0_g1~~TRINITY_DN15910_c0_g1_i13.p1  ORF type:complete len:245 (-),score=34.56 TRINITY_DN15910_c0_g1_i13:27-761(-)
MCIRDRLHMAFSPDRYEDKHAAGGAQFHRPQYSSRSYQSNRPQASSVYPGEVVPRAPYATEASVNDAQPHNDLPNNVPLYHITHYERPVNAPQPVPASPILNHSEDEPPASRLNPEARVHHSCTTQNWMTSHDSSLCSARSQARPGGLAPCNNEIKSLLQGQQGSPPTAAPSPTNAEPTGVNPHSSPIQGWHANYDSSLHQYRRKADEFASTVPVTTAGQGKGQNAHVDDGHTTSVGQILHGQR